MKNFIVRFVAALTITAFFFYSCKKDNTAKPNCTYLATQVSLANMAYNADSSTAHCWQLKEAYADYINSACVPSEQRNGAQKQLTILKEICP